MRRIAPLPAVAVLLTLTGCATAPTLTESGHRDAYLGCRVRIVGEVSKTKAAEILGIEVDADSPDLRGQMAEAEGVLERRVITKEEFDEAWRKEGPFQTRGPGVFYRLRKPLSVQTAKAISLNEAQSRRVPVRLGDGDEAVRTKMHSVGARDVTSKTRYDFRGAYLGEQKYYWWEMKDGTIVAILLLGRTDDALKVITIEIGEPGRGVAGIATWRSQKLTLIDAEPRPTTAP